MAGQPSLVLVATACAGAAALSIQCLPLTMARSDWVTGGLEIREGALSLQDVALLSMVADEIGGNTVSGGWTIPHPLSLSVFDDADANARKTVLGEPWQVVM
jgi:hypothetical protein